MAGVDTRSVSRDSLFLLANVQVEQGAEQYRVRVRNLSDGGMMGEGPAKVARGNRVTVSLRNVGAVLGTVAWVQDQRFGIAFDDEIDSALARKPTADGAADPAASSSMSYAHRAPPPPASGKLRKV